jgi:hypothetical protein
VKLRTSQEDGHILEQRRHNGALRWRWRNHWSRGVTVVDRLLGRAVERIAVLRVYIKVLSPPSSSIQTIQFNLGEDGIHHSKAKSITTAIAEADADLFDRRRAMNKKLRCPIRMP